MYFSDHYNGEPFIRNDMVAYACGEIVVAKFTEDETYYRARVVDSDFDNRQVKVGKGYSPNSSTNKSYNTMRNKLTA